MYHAALALLCTCAEAVNHPQKKPGGWRAPGLQASAAVADRDALAYMRLTVATACAT
ncbi:hypothetical protein GGR65_001890 [Xanthomonas sp. 3376]|uniref:Uncharacterized protein n=1 Tax=Xanthomonas arboricola TaxID=56448 RepID=A0AAU9HZF1_9XANT|nr:hypothetical protein [Xanthomonas arboricola]CAE6688532.1 hypothetical protein XA1314C_01160 [Xanthomonas arboricola]CAE6688542.1 hypothetical protein XA1314C_01160 [Xanthomonas arboricola]